MPCFPDQEATLPGPGNTQRDIPMEARGAMAGFGELAGRGQAGQIGALQKRGGGSGRARKVEVAVGGLEHQTQRLDPRQREPWQPLE